MTHHPVLTRRMLLRDMGKAGLAVAVFGVAACSAGKGSATTTPATTSTTLGTPLEPSTTAAQTSTSVSITESAWWRVVLGSVSAYILVRNGEAVVIDTGNGGSAPDIEAGLEELGVGWNAVGQVVITHQHPDHQGSLGAVLESASDPPWYAGADDMDAIRAPYAGVAVGDGDQVFDMDVIETPGHTPGHITMLDRTARILFAGDAMNGQNGTVTGANPRFTSDMAVADESIRKLAGFEFDTVVFGHGDPVVSGASHAVAELADSL